MAGPSRLAPGVSIPSSPMQRHNSIIDTSESSHLPCLTSAHRTDLISINYPVIPGKLLNL